MRISDIIAPASIAVHVPIEHKSHALSFAAEALSARCNVDLPAERIREALAAREALGSTGIGRGVAIPHVCFRDLDRPCAFFFTLAAAIDFGSIDDEPVDLICAMLNPPSQGRGADASLSHLAAIARMLRDPGRADALRKAKNPWNVYDIVVKSTEVAHLVG
jgi:nitrogen PTS system EIIA component